jgi:hypothetical protein
MSKEPTLLKKITLKAIGGLSRETSKADTIAFFKDVVTKNPDFCAIVGDITGYGNTVTAFGASTYFSGTFVACNRSTGEQFKSSKVYLPADLASIAVAAFNGKKADAEGIHFHAHIRVVLDASSATGYTFVSEPIKSPESINREAELMAKLTSMPAPKLIAGAKKAS